VKSFEFITTKFHGLNLLKKIVATGFYILNRKKLKTSIFSEKISPANDGLFVVDGLFVHEGLYVYVQLT